MTNSVQLTLGGCEYLVARARLGQYLQLQAIIEALEEAVEARDSGAINDAIFRYLTTAIADLSRDDLRPLPWYELLNAYNLISTLNTIPESTRFAILRRVEERKGRSIPWNYVGRSAVFWTHILASAYHWSKDAIENLWPEEAIAFIQEIMVDDQLEREFLHSLSEVAYHYDKSTKKSRYQPLTRPLFMVEGTARKRPRISLHRKMLPMGNVVYPDGAEVDERLAQAHNN